MNKQKYKQSVTVAEMDKEITVMDNEDVHPVHEEIADDNADEHAVKQEAQDASMYKLVAQKIVK